MLGESGPQGEPGEPGVPGNDGLDGEPVSRDEMFIWICSYDTDEVHFRSHMYTVDYIHHLITHDVIYSVKHLMNV